MPSGQCWFTTQPKNADHNGLLVDIFGKAIHRIFVHIGDVQPKLSTESWSQYMEHTINDLPCGMRYWQNDEGQDHVYTSVTGEGSTKDMLVMCKNEGAIPLICIGHTEEKSSWIGRNPISQVGFLQGFCNALAGYLYNMGFTQAHLEIWNEPQKCIPGADYATICKYMIKGFAISPNYKVHVGSNDITIDFSYKNFIDDELRSMLKGHYYSTHILQHGHHGKLAQFINDIKPIKVSVTEFSPNGEWGRFGEGDDWGNLNEIKNVPIYCFLFGIRRDFFGDIYDEIRVFTREGRPDLGIPPGGWLPNAYNQKKHLALKNFNTKYFSKPLPLEDEDMQLYSTYKKGVNGMGTKFIQKVCNKMNGSALSVDGKFGSLTETEVIKVNKTLGFTSEPEIVYKDRFKAYINLYPDVWNDVEHSWDIGER